MASFAQFLASHERGERKRAYLTYGPERALAEMVVDEVRTSTEATDENRQTVSARDDGTAACWAAINQYPIDPLDKRLVVVRDAEAIKDWTIYLNWLEARTIPQVTAVITINEDELDSKQDHIQRTAKSGRLVHCTPPNAKDAASILKHARPGLEDSAAAHLLKRTKGDIRASLNAIHKAAMWQGRLTPDIIDILAERLPATEFVEELTALHKAAAMEAIPHIPPDDVPRIVGQIDYRLTQLTSLHRMARRNKTARDIIRSSDIPPFVVINLLPVAKHYTPRAARARTATLAAVDAQVQRGAREGVLETLVTLW